MNSGDYVVKYLNYEDGKEYVAFRSKIKEDAEKYLADSFRGKHGFLEEEMQTLCLVKE